MDNVQFSSEFDILFNNISSNQAPQLDLYEKSVFLTKAQGDIVKNYFIPRSAGNPTKMGFDMSEKRQQELSYLITETKGQLIGNYSGLTMSDHSYIYKISYSQYPLVILNEIIDKYHTDEDQVTHKRRCNIVPIHYSEYSRLISDPYKGPVKNEVWKLILSGQKNDNEIESITELVCGVGFSLKDDNSYIIRYVRKPRPIILANLNNSSISGLNIDGISTLTQCELPESIHSEILQRAVEYAMVSWNDDLNKANASIQTIGGRVE